MTYLYSCNWDDENNKPSGIISQKEAQERFDAGEPFVIMVGGDSPTAFLSVVRNKSIYISKFDKNLNEKKSYSYIAIDKNQSDQLFLTMMVQREFDKDNSLKRSAHQHYAKIEGLQETGEDLWLTQERAFCVEVNLDTGGVKQYEAEEKIDGDSLWIKFPEFGKWEELFSQIDKKK
ncbi:hypothetical protein A9Q91_00790 [Candidatus Gracilibacteria bacterium 28_42_T64]|nr:hypothetical protein A9Q91_00790 [Candidatus Gracilibacteria bacterium 28_42_T64]